MRKPFALGIVYCTGQPLHLYSLISKDMDNILHVPLAPTSPVYLFLMAQHAYFSFTWQQNTCRVFMETGLMLNSVA